MPMRTAQNTPFKRQSLHPVRRPFPCMVAPTTHDAEFSFNWDKSEKSEKSDKLPPPLNMNV